MKRLLILISILCYGFLSHGQDTTVVAMEYFWNTDPGYGNGTPVTITNGLTIDENFSISTGGLSLGFNTLFVRVQNSSGYWGMAESRLVYVDVTSADVVNDISALEYLLAPGLV